jgi:hypothetical protein
MSEEVKRIQFASRKRQRPLPSVKQEHEEEEEGKEGKEEKVTTRPPPPTQSIGA